jgi:molybdate transport system substrate-binding protein
MSIEPFFARGERQARSLWTLLAVVSALTPAGCADKKDPSPTTPVDMPPDASISSVDAGSLRDRILTGTSGADVAIVTPAVIAALDAQSLVHAGSRVDLAQIGGGLAVRSADQAPDISDSDKFKAALLAADEIYYADPALATAGAAFIKICGTLGIADTCAVAPAGKGHTAPVGAQAMAAMAASTATTVVGATQISEIESTPGVRLVGEYPGAPLDLQVKTVYSAIIVAGAQNLAGAQMLLQFLGGDIFKANLAMYGFEPPPPGP